MVRIMALDLGSVRTGVAFSDHTQTLATPGDSPLQGADSPGFSAEIRGLVASNDVGRVLVGIPRSLDGTRGPMAYWAEGIRRMLASDLSIPVEGRDERFSSDEAARRLQSAGASRRGIRDVIDSAAAAVILQEYLDSRRTNAGTVPGGASNP